jgi:diguanylate cyclase (GGDEF)-like protein/PAS domain S-box-containing protein
MKKNIFLSFLLFFRVVLFAEPITPIPLHVDDIDKQKAILGKELFFDPILSRDGTIACVNCHVLSEGGDDGLKFSFGINGQKGNINSPTVLNARYNFSQFWDGRAKEEKNQNIIFNIIFFLAGLFLVVIFISYLRLLKLKEELISFKYAVENSDDSVVVTDKNRQITYVNEAFVKTTGYTKEEAYGKNPNILKSGKMPQEFYEDMNEILNRGEKWSGEFINKDKFGNIYYEQASITPMYLGGVLRGYLAIKLNITDYIKQKQEVEFLAYHDSLTKLSNRYSMKKELEKVFSLGTIGLDLMFLDLDGFKFINDTLGHNIGDILLKKIALRLKNSVSKTDLVFRTGGDEFAVIVRYTSKVSHSAKLAYKIIDEINRTIVIGKHKLKVGISIGIAKYSKERDDLTSLLKHADIAMYEAKLKGKNRFKFYTKKLALRLQKKMQTERLLENAINNGEMYVVYQPKYELNSKKIIGFEALLRWDSSELGSVSPAYFIPIAESLSIIHDIGSFVFKKACGDFKELKKVYKDLKSISTNLSTSQLMNKNLLNEFKNITKELEIEPKNIALEITETNVMKNIKKSAEILNEMRNFGFEIELDDFGTGYSSMSYLKKLPISIIKIDKSFVDDILIDENDVKIIKAMILVSKSFGYKTIAEGIENLAQENLLKNLGVDYGQGFYFSKPKRKEELI